MRLFVIVAGLLILTWAVSRIFTKVELYGQGVLADRKIDSFAQVANRAVKLADSLQAICDTLKQKRSVSIVEVTKWREKRLNDTFWGTLEDTAKITYLLQENDSLFRIVELDTEIIEKQDSTILSQKVAISAKDSVINHTLSGIKALSNENSYLKRVNTKVKRQRNWSFLAGVLIGVIAK
jgi:hypothetical protein